MDLRCESLPILSTVFIYSVLTTQGPLSVIRMAQNAYNPLIWHVATHPKDALWRSQEKGVFLKNISNCDFSGILPKKTSNPCTKIVLGILISSKIS